MNQYTPGPWHQSAGVTILTSDEHDLSIALMNTRRIEWEANARLIAAAPELLAYHQAIVDLAAGWDEEGATAPREPLSWKTVALMALDYACAAIAKAKGSA